MVEFTEENLEVLDKALRSFGLSGIENPVKIVIFFAFVDGQGFKELSCRTRTFKQIQEQVDNTFGLHQRQAQTALNRLMEARCVRVNKKNYELTGKGKAFVIFLSSFNQAWH